MHCGAEFASWQSRETSSALLITGLKNSFTGRALDNASVICRACVSTFFRVSLPYKCWLPVKNQTSSCFKLITVGTFLLKCFHAIFKLDKFLDDSALLSQAVVVIPNLYHLVAL
jgi:hypothetical protein